MSSARTCNDQGACHGRPALGCTCHQHDTLRLRVGEHYFAPGVIEGGTPQPVPRRWTLGRVLRYALGALVVLCLVGFAAGYAAGVLQQGGLL